MKRSGYKRRSKTVLVVEQDNYVNEFVNVYITYDLNDWLRITLIKNCLFGATNGVKNSDKTRYVCSG